jgi:PKD repeat protein
MLIRAGILLVAERSDCLLALAVLPGGAEALDELGYMRRTLDTDTSGWNYFSVQLREGASSGDLKDCGEVIWTEGNWAILRARDTVSLPCRQSSGWRIHRLDLQPMMEPDPPPAEFAALQGGAVPRLTPKPLVQEIANLATPTLVQANWDQIFASATGRYSTAPGCAAATQMVYEKFTNLNLGPIKQDHTAENAPNIIGVITGKANPEKVCIIVGHIDDLPATGPAPGANDNASGTCAVMTAAEVMAGYTFKNTVKFLVVTGEEIDILGSTYYAAQAKAAGEQIQGVLNGDMIGWAGDGLPAAGEDLDLSYDAPSQWLATLFAQCAADYNTGCPVLPILCPSNTASDHSPFWTQGYSAVFGITDNEDECGYAGNYPFYHKATDTKANCGNPAFFNTVVKAYAATLAHMADPLCKAPAPPTGLFATAAGANIALTWTPSAAGMNHEVHRAQGPCSTAKPFAKIGESATGAFTDSAAAPGVTYAYKIYSKDSTGYCLSATAPCAEGSVPNVSCALVCTATVPVSGATGASIPFASTATPTGCAGAPSYSWNFGDAATSSLQNPTHTYAAAGTFAWTLTVTADAVPCTRSGSIAIAAGASIQDIEVNQVLGRKKSGTASVPQTDFVAGKDTAVVVTLTQAVAVDTSGQSQKVEVFKGDTKVVTLAPSPSAAPTAILTFLCPNRGACGDWAVGSYRFVATVNGATLTREGVSFLARKPMKILAVPIKANYGGAIKVPDDRWKQGGDFMKTVYPVSAAGFNWVLGQQLDLSASKYDLNTNAGGRAVWEALVDLQPTVCSGNPTNPNCYDVIIGFVKDMIPDRAKLYGYTYGPPATVVVSEVEGMPATVAHEVGHNYGLGDEYDGGTLCCEVNPPPPSYSGSNWDGTATIQCTASTSVEGPEGQGSRIYATIDRPFEIGGRGRIASDLTSYMGTDAAQPANWTTPTMYAWLFTKLNPTRSDDAMHSNPVGMVEISGWVNKDTDAVELGLPWTTFEMEEPFTPETGPYGVRVVDENGSALAAQGFTPVFFVHSNPPKPLAEAPFEVALPLPETAAKIQIVKGDAVIAEIPLSESAPVFDSLLVATPDPSGVAAITWAAHDPDGDSLWYDVEYSPTGLDEDYYPQAQALQVTQFALDLNQLPGGAAARVRVTATDGIRAEEGTSDPFPVPAKPPEVFIDGPLQNAVYMVGDEVTLNGAAYDPQDEWIEDDTKLVWTSERDGELGTGELVFLDDLTPGSQIITLTATNSFSLSSSRSVTVTIRSGMPGDCDGNGAVSIGEVQKAINMFLGLISPDCGADCSGDGVISIGEVQNVINGFLGLAASCSR